MRAKRTWPVDWVDTPQKNTTLKKSGHDSHTILNDFVSMCIGLMLLGISWQTLGT